MAKYFEDLEIWKQAREFCKDIYKITNYELFSKDYRFREQIRASSGETRSQLHRALDNNYIHTDEFEILSNRASQLSKSIFKLIQHLKDSHFSGPKNIPPLKP
jgi:hypothetical protein